MAYKNVKEIYPPVCLWLERFLQNRHPKAKIYVFDSSKRGVARIIEEKGLSANLPAEWQSWDIYVDVVGFACTEKQTFLAFVECKISFITLSHLSQLLGYSRVARPQYSIITSPKGASNSLISLLLTFGRTDVLKYHTEQGKIPLSVAVSRWDENGNCLDIGSLIAGNNNLWR